MARVITMTEIKSGVVTLVDLLKINALLDMKADTEQYYWDQAQADQKDGGRH